MPRPQKGSQPPDLGMHRVWLHPFTPELRGGLRGKVNQYSDPSGNILTPRGMPQSMRRNYSYLNPSSV